MNDLLGEALKVKKKRPVSDSSRKRRNAILNTEEPSRTPIIVKKKKKRGLLTAHPTTTAQRTTTIKKKQLKCSFCNNNQAVVTIQKSFTSKPYCLFHYYTTRACRIATHKVSLIETEDKDEFHTQLPYVQELFSEAFTELQKEISAESSKSFQSMLAKGNDPLSVLKMPSRGSKLRKAKNKGVNRKKNIGDNGKGTVNNDDNEGGFMRQLQTREITLMENQTQRIEQAARESVEKVKQQSNLYKRRKTSSKSSWHMVLDKKVKGLSENNTDVMNSNFMSDVVEGIICSCGSQKVKLCGNVTSRNNDVSKADTWGFKRDNDNSSRYQCMTCNKTWNEES